MKSLFGRERENGGCRQRVSRRQLQEGGYEVEGTQGCGGLDKPALPTRPGFPL